jgi:hypothetical protein
MTAPLMKGDATGVPPELFLFSTCCLLRGSGHREVWRGALQRRSSNKPSVAKANAQAIIIAP